MSKGSKPRPIENKEEFDKKWTKVFGKKKDVVKEREEALQELARMSQEMGLYEEKESK